MELTENIPVTVRFIAEKKRSKNNDEYLIYARILLKRDKALVALNIKKVKEEDWDFENSQFHQKENYKARNNQLIQAEFKIGEIYKTLKRAGISVTAKLIKRAYDGNTDEDTTADSETKFITYYKQYIDEIKQKPNEYGEGVIAHYNKTKIHLERFLKLQNLEKIKMSELSGKFLEKFENYLLTTPNAQTERPMNNNTCTTYMRKVKAAVNAAVRKEMLTVNPFQNFKLKPFKTANRVFLTIEEVELLRKHDLGGNAALQRVRDTFVFCCATGLRHSDAVQLHKKMIKVDKEGVFWINLFQKKTKEYIEIPMTDAAIEIYNRFESHRKTTGFVLPMLTNQKVNTSLKVIADILDINKRLSFHASRHSFATNSLEHGVDIASISSLMGHRTIKTTQIYAKTTRKRKVDVIKYLNERNKPQKKEVVKKRKK